MVEFVSCNFWRSLKLPRRKFWHCHLLVESRRWRGEWCIYSTSFIAHLHVRAAHGAERPPRGPDGLPGSKPASSSDHSWIEKSPQAKRNLTEGAKKAARWRITCAKCGQNKEMQQVKTKNVVGTTKVKVLLYFDFSAPNRWNLCGKYPLMHRYWPLSQPSNGLLFG